PTIADMWGAGGQFDLTSTTRIVANDSSGPFANPPGEDDTFWNDKWLLLGRGVSSVAEMVLAKTASTNAKVDDNTLDLDPSWAAPNTATDINISFEMAYGAMTADDNTVTFAAPVLTSDDEGRMIHFLKAGVDGDAEREILSAYIRPGS